MRAEAAALDGEIASAEEADEGLVEAPSVLGRGGAAEVGATAMSHVAVEGELRHGEERAADLAERAVHLARLVIEHPQLGELAGEELGIAGMILTADPEQRH